MLVAVEFYIFFFNFSNLNSTIKDSSFASQKDDLGLHKASASCSGNMETWKGNLLEQLEYEHYVYWPLNRVVQNPILSVSNSIQIMIWKTKLLIKFNHF